MTKLRDHGRNLLMLLAVSILVIGTACGGSSGTTADIPRGEVFDYVVPRGTQQLLDKGAVITLMPARLEMKVGDVLRIRNDDDVDQLVGPYLIKAGKQFELQYRSPGRFEGACALSGSDTFEIIVT